MQIRSALLTTCAAAALTLSLGMGSALAIPLSNVGTVGPISSGGNTFSNIGCTITMAGGLAFPNNCNQIDALYKRLKTCPIDIIEPINDTFYHARQFGIRRADGDINRHILVGLILHDDGQLDFIAEIHKARR